MSESNNKSISSNLTQITNGKRNPSPKVPRSRSKSPNRTKNTINKSSLSPTRQKHVTNESIEKQNSSCDCACEHEIRSTENLIYNQGDVLKDKQESGVSESLDEMIGTSVDEGCYRQEEYMTLCPMKIVPIDSHSNVWDDPLPMYFNDAHFQENLSLYSNHLPTDEGTSIELPTSINEIFSDIFFPMIRKMGSPNLRKLHQSTSVPVFVNDLDKDNNAKDEESDLSEEEIEHISPCCLMSGISINDMSWRDDTNANNGNEGSDGANGKESNNQTPPSSNQFTINNLHRTPVNQEIYQSFVQSLQTGYTNESFEDINLEDDLEDVDNTAARNHITNEQTQATICTDTEHKEQRKSSSVFQRARKLTRNALLKIRGRSPTPTDMRDAIGSVVSVGKSIYQKSKDTIKAAHCVSMDNEIEYADCFDGVIADLEVLKRVSNEIPKGVSAGIGIPSFVSMKEIKQSDKGYIDPQQPGHSDQYIEGSIDTSQNVNNLVNSSMKKKKKRSDLPIVGGGFQNNEDIMSCPATSKGARAENGIQPDMLLKNTKQSDTDTGCSQKLDRSEKYNEGDILQHGGMKATTDLIHSFVDIEKKPSNLLIIDDVRSNCLIHDNKAKCQTMKTNDEISHCPVETEDITFDFSNFDDVIFCVENDIIVDGNEPWEKIKDSDLEINENESGIINGSDGAKNETIETVGDILYLMDQGETISNEIKSVSQQIYNTKPQCEPYSMENDEENNPFISDTSIVSPPQDYVKLAGFQRDIAVNEMALENACPEFKGSSRSLVVQSELVKNIKPCIADDGAVLFKSSMSDGSFDAMASESEDMPRKTVSLVISNEADTQDRDITDVMALISDEASLKRYPSLPDLTDLEKDPGHSISTSFNSKDDEDSDIQSLQNEFELANAKLHLQVHDPGTTGVTEKKLKNADRFVSAAGVSAENIGEGEETPHPHEMEAPIYRHLMKVQDHGYDTDDDQRSSDLSSCDGAPLDSGVKKALRMDIYTPPNSPRGGFPLESNAVNAIIFLFETTSILSKTGSHEDDHQQGQEGGRCTKNAGVVITEENVDEVEAEKKVKSIEDCTIDSMYNNAINLLHVNKMSTETIALCDGDNAMKSNESLKYNELFDTSPSNETNEETQNLDGMKNEVFDGTFVIDLDGCHSNSFPEPYNSEEIDALINCLPSPPNSSITQRDTVVKTNDSDVVDIVSKDKGAEDLLKDVKMNAFKNGEDEKQRNKCVVEDNYTKHGDTNEAVLKRDIIESNIDICEVCETNVVNGKDVEESKDPELEPLLEQNETHKMSEGIDDMQTPIETQCRPREYNATADDIDNTNPDCKQVFDNKPVEEGNSVPIKAVKFVSPIGTKRENTFLDCACSSFSAERWLTSTFPGKDHTLSPILIRKCEPRNPSGLLFSPRRLLKHGKVTWAVDHEFERTTNYGNDDDDDDDESLNSAYDFSNSCQVGKTKPITVSQCQNPTPYHLLEHNPRSSLNHEIDLTRQLLEMAKQTLDHRTYMRSNDPVNNTPLASVAHPPSTPAPPSSPDLSMFVTYSPQNKNCQNTEFPRNDKSIQATYAAACEMIDRVSEKMDCNLEAVRRASIYIKRTQQQVHLCDELMARTKNTLHKSAEISAKVRNQVELVARFLATTESSSEPKYSN